MAACTISEVNLGQNDAPALAAAVRDFVLERYRADTARHHGVGSTEIVASGHLFI